MISLIDVFLTFSTPPNITHTTRTTNFSHTTSCKVPPCAVRNGSAGFNRMMLYHPNND